MLPAVLEERWDVRVPDAYEPRYNVAPGAALATVPVGDPAVDLLEWGLLPGWVEDPDDWHFPINARAETVAENGAFREAFAQRPCLVPSSGYYEWTGTPGSTQPYRVCRTDREPFALAGLWERWESDGTQRETVTIVTCEANDVVESIHHRMPLVLAPGEESQWLHGDVDDRLSLLEPPDGSGFETYPIPKAIDDPTAEGPELIEPLSHEQGELGAFGA
jgi:putative SOS response-associated peptidase YedK